MTTTTIGNDNGHNNSNSSGYIALKERIEGLDFNTFQLCVTLWLGAKGYEAIRSLGRHARRGRRKIGGADLLAVWPGVPKSAVAIQIRHRRTPINRQAVDELRGFMLRHDISAGVIVTNTVFGPAAEKAATIFPGRPIALLSSKDFAWSLYEHRLGVQRVGGGYALDERYFEALELLRFASAPPAQQTERPVRPNEARTLPAPVLISAPEPDLPTRTKPERRLDWELLIVLVAGCMLLAVILGAFLGAGR